jgi:CBS domain-containing protein
MANITASQVMTRDVLTVGADWSVEQLGGFLTHHSITGAPVVSERGALVGVVSLTDLARGAARIDPAASSPHAYYARALEMVVGQGELSNFRIQHEPATTVREVMSPVVFGVDERTPIQEVANMMITGRIHRVLVTRDDKMVGIISSLDLLPLVRDLPMST